MRALALLLLSFLAVAFVADAQMFPKRERPAREDRERPREPERTRPANEPYIALERELPSLRTDLKLRADQLDDWRMFERHVRTIAEMERSRRRRLMALPEAGDQTPNALAYIGSLGDEDRSKGEAAANMKRHFESLYDKLDDSQRKLLDRRVIQSQVEPLGRQ